jgi:hypothetical protein
MASHQERVQVQGVAHPLLKGWPTRRVVEVATNHQVGHIKLITIDANRLTEFLEDGSRRPISIHVAIDQEERPEADQHILII